MTTLVVVLGLAAALTWAAAWAVGLRLRYWQRRIDRALAEQQEATAVEQAQSNARRIVLEAELVVAEEYLRIQRGRR